MVNSRDKGKRGELEFVKFLKQEGFDEARRTQQYCGTEGASDVILQGIHVEVKRTQKLNIYDAMAQAMHDSAGEIPVVAHRRNNDYWKITMKAEDFLQLYREWRE